METFIVKYVNICVKIFTNSSGAPPKNFEPGFEAEYSSLF